MKLKLYKISFITDVGNTLVALALELTILPFIKMYAAIHVAYKQLKLDYTNNLYEPKDEL